MRRDSALRLAGAAGGAAEFRGGRAGRRRGDGDRQPAIARIAQLAGAPKAAGAGIDLFAGSAGVRRRAAVRDVCALRRRSRSTRAASNAAADPAAVSASVSELPRDFTAHPNGRIPKELAIAARLRRRTCPWPSGLAAELRCELAMVVEHRFPDGEIKLTLPPSLPGTWCCCAACSAQRAPRAAAAHGQDGAPPRREAPHARLALPGLHAQDIEFNPARRSASASSPASSASCSSASSPSTRTCTASPRWTR